MKPQILENKPGWEKRLLKNPPTRTINELGTKSPQCRTKRTKTHSKTKSVLESLPFDFPGQLFSNRQLNVYFFTGRLKNINASFHILSIDKYLDFYQPIR